MYRGAMRYGYVGAVHGKYQTPCSTNPVNIGSTGGMRGPAGPPALQIAGANTPSITMRTTTPLSSFVKSQPPSK